MGDRQDVTYRGATEADIAPAHAVFVAAEGELSGRHGFGWSEPPPLDSVAPTLQHLLAHDGERFFVAEVAGSVVGLGAAFVRTDTWYLAWLFIDPAHQGRGIGRQLLELVLTAAPPHRITITSSIQPISNALYSRHGLLPATPVLGFEGSVEVEAPRDLLAGDANPAALADLDQAAYGFDRALDHAYWRSRAGATVWSRGGEPVAYSYRWPSGRIGPLAGRDGESAASALRAELARGQQATVDIPGTCRPLVREALSAGMRMVAPVGLLLLSDAVAAPQSLAISSYGLF